MVYTKRSFQIAVINGVKFSSITEGKNGLLFCILAND